MQSRSPGGSKRFSPGFGWLSRFQAWVAGQAGTDKALWVLAGVSFAESAFLPVPVEIVSLPVMMANTRRIWKVALLAAAASVAGGVFGYAIGYYLYQSIGVWLIGLYGAQAQAMELQQAYKEMGWVVTLIGGLTPVPYKLVAIVSGVAGMSLPVFIIASIISRTVRFLAFALVFWWFGPRIRALAQKYQSLLSLVVLVVFIAGMIAFTCLF